MPFDNPHQMPFGDLEILRDARSRIAEEGNWLKGDFRDGDRHCLVAALSVAAGSRAFNIPNKAERRLARFLVARLPTKMSLWARLRMPVRLRLIYFNDDARTTHSDVVALYDRAIEHLASKAPICTVV